MNLDRPGTKHDDGVFVFDDPVLVRHIGMSGKTYQTYAEGYRTNCGCGTCVYVNPWPLYASSRVYALHNSILEEIE